MPILSAMAANGMFSSWSPIAAFVDGVNSGSGSRLA